MSDPTPSTTPYHDGLVTLAAAVGAIVATRDQYSDTVLLNHLERAYHDYEAVAWPADRPLPASVQAHRQAVAERHAAEHPICGHCGEPLDPITGQHELTLGYGHVCRLRHLRNARGEAQ